MEHFDYKLLQGFGEDVFISKNVDIKRPNSVTVGSHVAIDTGFYLTTNAVIGNFVHIAPYVSCIGGANAYLQIGDYCGIAAGARLIVIGDEHLGAGLTGPTIPAPFRDKLIGGVMKMERFVNVGTNAVVMPGLTLREGSVLGAGAVLTRDTEPWTIYVGIPARAMKKRDGKKMIEHARSIEDRQ
jgi:acetyltransferase-like isoleucine patch superfamily enzyme